MESVKRVLKEATGTPSKNTRDVVHQIKTDQPWNPYKTINKDVVRGEGRNEDRIRVALNAVEETVEDLSIKIEDFDELNSFAYGKDGDWYGEHENNKPVANLRNYTAKMRKAINLLRTVISMAKKESYYEFRRTAIPISRQI